ncbi:MAG: hypothetical protein IIV99_02590, partial [Oscillospiraceae bacterium]|nr:hypothetical protein [Oscillospiraceae bacterium]
MTQLSQIILDRYQVRKSKQQKTDFINLLNQHLPTEIQTGGLLKSRNIVVGDLNTAKVVFTAHYDTCPRLPFPNFITPKNFFYYLVYQLLITVVLLAVLFVVAFGLAYVTDLICDALAIGEDL